MFIELFLRHLGEELVLGKAEEMLAVIIPFLMAFAFKWISDFMVADIWVCEACLEFS